jgi:hypothetical protein
MIKIEKDQKIILAIEDPEAQKLALQLKKLLERYPELENSLYVTSINKLNKDAIEEIKKINEIATGKKEAKLPIFVISINAYTNIVDDFIRALKDLNFTNKRRGLVFAFLGIDDPEIEYQMTTLKDLERIIDSRDIEEDRLGFVIRVVDLNDVETYEKMKEYIEGLNEKIYGEKGLKLPVFGIFYTYSTNNLVEFETYLDYINKLT